MDSEKHLILYIFDLENDAVVKVLLSQEFFFSFSVCVCLLFNVCRGKQLFHFIFVKAASQLNLLFFLES